MVRIWRSTARCYPKCYLNPTLLEFSRGLLHSQTRHLQAIAGLPQGHEGTERNHNPRVGGSSPSSATLQTSSEQRFPAGLVFALRTISAWCYLKRRPTPDHGEEVAVGVHGERDGIMPQDCLVVSRCSPQCAADHTVWRHPSAKSTTRQFFWFLNAEVQCPGMNYYTCCCFT